MICFMLKLATLLLSIASANPQINPEVCSAVSRIGGVGYDFTRAIWLFPEMRVPKGTIILRGQVNVAGRELVSLIDQACAPRRQLGQRANLSKAASLGGLFLTS